MWCRVLDLQTTATAPGGAVLTVALERPWDSGSWACGLLSLWSARPVAPPVLWGSPQWSVSEHKYCVSQGLRGMMAHSGGHVSYVLLSCG